MLIKFYDLQSSPVLVSSKKVISLLTTLVNKSILILLAILSLIKLNMYPLNPVNIPVIYKNVKFKLFNLTKTMIISYKHKLLT